MNADYSVGHAILIGVHQNIPLKRGFLVSKHTSLM